ncbi:NYN domain-containing protein [Desulfovibrio sp. OttesenSCG-928-M16]|nr:NYN domain-containing protein [Desulfovibrio sp. OttesenSCG-928-M16]
MPDAAKPQEITPARVMFFVDFWNYELTMRELEPTFLTNWFLLPPTITQEVSRLIDAPVQYERCFIFGSYDPASTGDAKLRAWATNVLSKVPGALVSFSPRQKRTRGPQCTGQSHHEVKNCPVCNASMLGTQEKGVDTQIATEMLDAALSGHCDAVVLVSADKDFIPAVDKLLNRNIKVIHAFFPNHGHELAGKSWASFDLFKVRDKFRR